MQRALTICCAHVLVAPHCTVFDEGLVHRYRATRTQCTVHHSNVHVVHLANVQNLLRCIGSNVFFPFIKNSRIIEAS